MILDFKKELITNYHSGSQIARVVTEKWVEDNMFCPRCGGQHIEHFPNNKPVADFFCPNCGNEYELKSKNGSFGHKINDGAYDSMIQRITSNNNPDFFFMSYSKDKYKVRDFMLIPKHFFVPNIIEKRKPLAQTAIRAGWTGCNILIDKVPMQGRVDIISNGKVHEMKEVLEKVHRGKALEIKDINARGWLLDILDCVNQMEEEFSLNEIYRFDGLLFEKHPQNNHVRAKIRQQLQILRDRGFIEFIGKGRYRKV